MSGFTFSKSERLCHEKAISRLFTEGRNGFMHPFRYFWLAVDAEQQDGRYPVAVLFSVPKKQFKRAVKRNLLKRRMREAYRLNKHILTGAAGNAGKKVELAFIYSNKELSDFKTIEDGIKRILEKVGKCL